MDELTPFDVLNTISSAWYGKQVYFLESDGRIYDRINSELITFEEAVDRFEKQLFIGN